MNIVHVLVSVFVYTFEFCFNRGKKKLETALSKAKDDMKTVTDQLKLAQICKFVF